MDGEMQTNNRSPRTRLPLLKIADNKVEKGHMPITTDEVTVEELLAEQHYTRLIMHFHGIPGILFTDVQVYEKEEYNYNTTHILDPYLILYSHGGRYHFISCDTVLELYDTLARFGLIDLAIARYPQIQNDTPAENNDQSEAEFTMPGKPLNPAISFLVEKCDAARDDAHNPLTDDQQLAKVNEDMKNRIVPLVGIERNASKQLKQWLESQIPADNLRKARAAREARTLKMGLQKTGSDSE